MHSALVRGIGQAACLAVFAAFIGYFAGAPRYQHLAPHRAVIKLSFTHAGDRVSECRRLTPEEIAALAPNMRRPLDCPRARVPVFVELDLDGKTLYRAAHRPAGLARDGASTAYERFVVPAGRHRITARLRDSRRERGFDYEDHANVVLVPGQSLVIEFRDDVGGFRFL